MLTRKFNYSIRTLLTITLIVGVGIVAWQYYNQPRPESAWEAFLLAVTTLQDTGNRKLAAQQFADVERLFPNSEYKAESLELAALLKKMIAEDRVWREPNNPEHLSLQERIKYHVHHLRDVNVYQTVQPGDCYLLSGFPSEYNAAIELRSIGEPAIPHLIGLLNDCRPIRSVGFWRIFHPSRIVLRYQDAAIQILDKLLPQEAFDRAIINAYFSSTSRANQDKVTQQIEAWWKTHSSN